MTPLLVFGVIAVYFVLLMLIAFFTSKKATDTTFFTGNKKSPWFLVAFGMIGASLSGVTFISVPGEVGNSAFSYFQIVLGYLLGYFIIANVLMPLYYKLNLVSIYSYLNNRFGLWSYKTGSLFFLLSQTIGASFRLFLVAVVLQIGFFDSFGIPFYITVLCILLLIWIYTYRAGIKTIVWTDTLQTFFMLLSVVVSILIIANELNLSTSELISTITQNRLSTVFNWDWHSKHFFLKQFFSGAFIAIVMTGLDQNMMQKNLTCKTLKDAKKNMYWFSGSLVFVNLLFLGLGVLLYVFAIEKGISLPVNQETGMYLNTDKLFPDLALNHFSITAGIIFLLGITAAAFSSADSALTALTTSFCIDFLDFDKKKDKNKKNIRFMVHIGFSLLLFSVIILFKSIKDDSVINAVFTVAGYTYGPLLGLYTFGLFTKFNVKDKLVPLVAILSPLVSYILSYYSEDWFNGYKFGFELLIVNGLMTFAGLMIIRKNKINTK